MSTPEHEYLPPVDSKSSVKITRNAKGDPQWEIKVRAGDTEAEVKEAQRIALAVHQDLARTLAGGR
jgi:hypothetical protein